MKLTRAIYLVILGGSFFSGVAFAREPSSFQDADLQQEPFYQDLVRRYGHHTSYTAQEILSVENPKPAMFKASDVKTHFGIIGKLDPTKTHLFDKLVGAFGRKATYSADEVRAIESPDVPSKDHLPPEKPHSRIDAFSKEEVRKHFELLRSSDPKTKATMEALEKKYPNQNYYSAAQVRDIEKNGADWVTLETRPDTPVTFVAKQQANANSSGWKTPMIRHDWTDVLITDDPSVGSLAKQKTDDLVGATFSYSHDKYAGTDTWSTVGAFIWPWVYDAPVKESILPQHVVIAPSVSVNRVSTSGNPATETDQVLYRLGFYGEWYEPLGLMTLLQVRAAPVFGTNTGHEARMPGYELDMEPSWLFNNGQNGKECVYKIGFRNILWFKEPLLADGSDQSVLDYQVRIWMHLEGGDIQDTGKGFAPTTGEFFRIGPVAQLRINSFFPVPVLSKGLSFTAQYSYLPTIEGPKGHDYLLNLAAALTILSDKANHEKLSLTGSYTYGGLIFTKQNVDTFTLGLSVLF